MDIINYLIQILPILIHHNSRKKNQRNLISKYYENLNSNITHKLFPNTTNQAKYNINQKKKTINKNKSITKPQSNIKNMKINLNNTEKNKSKSNSKSKSRNKIKKK